MIHDTPSPQTRHETAHVAHLTKGVQGLNSLEHLTLNETDGSSNPPRPQNLPTAQAISLGVK